MAHLALGPEPDREHGSQLAAGAGEVGRLRDPIGNLALAQAGGVLFGLRKRCEVRPILTPNCWETLAAISGPFKRHASIPAVPPPEARAAWSSPSSSAAIALVAVATSSCCAFWVAVIPGG